MFLGEAVEAFAKGELQLQPQVEMLKNGELWLMDRLKLLQGFELQAAIQVPKHSVRLRLSVFAGSFWQLFKQAASTGPDAHVLVDGMISVEVAQRKSCYWIF